MRGAGARRQSPRWAPGDAPVVAEHLELGRAGVGEGERRSDAGAEVDRSLEGQSADEVRSGARVKT
jgi:hypothetical protein